MQSTEKGSDQVVVTLEREAVKAFVTYGTKRALMAPLRAALDAPSRSVTDEMVEEAARTLWTMRTESSEDLWANGELHGDEREMYRTEARLILTAALDTGSQEGEIEGEVKSHSLIDYSSLPIAARKVLALRRPLGNWEKRHYLPDNAEVRDALDDLASAVEALDSSVAAEVDRLEALSTGEPTQPSVDLEVEPCKSCGGSETALRQGNGEWISEPCPDCSHEDVGGDEEVWRLWRRRGGVWNVGLGPHENDIENVEVVRRDSLLSKEAVREKLLSDGIIETAGEIADDLDLGLSSEGAEIVADKILRAAVTAAFGEETPDA